MIICGWIFLECDYLKTKFVEKPKRLRFSENGAVYELMLKNMCEPAWSQLTTY